MKKIALAASIVAFGAGGAVAGGLDRSYTHIDQIFEKGNYAELSFGYIDPTLEGRDLLGNPISNVADSFTNVGGALKLDFGDKMSFAVIFDQPYGTDIHYGGSPVATLLGGTSAVSDSNALTVLLKYKVTDRISLYGGPRAVEADGTINLKGLAYGPLNGYRVKLNSDYGLGAVVGAAYEIPKIAFRAALTWHSSVDLNFNTVEAFPIAPGVPGPAIATGKTKSELPQSLRLTLQSGISRNTLLFGSVRWSEWSAFNIDPPSVAPNLSELDDVYGYEIGIGHRFTDRLSARVSYDYEPSQGDSLVSPLLPYNGLQALTLGAKYKLTDHVDLSGGVRYIVLGNAKPETGTPDTARGNYKNNDAVSVGFKLGVHF